MSQEPSVEPATPQIEQPPTSPQSWLSRSPWGEISLASALVIGIVSLGVHFSSLLPAILRTLCSVSVLLALVAIPVGLISGLVGTSADQNKLAAWIGLVLHLLIIAFIVFVLLAPVWATIFNPQLAPE